MKEKETSIYRPKYSFIIPAYNAERTIKKTIDSITSQMEDYEIIVAENGSVDKTSSVVERIAETNNRIKLIHSDKGVSKARNDGIRIAAGEWIIFVDADDLWLANYDTINHLTNNNKLDLIVCSYQKDNTYITHDFQPEDKPLTGRVLTEMFEWMLIKPTLRMTVWAKVFKSETIRLSGIKFNESLRFSEDAEFLISLMESCNSALVSEAHIYKYCTDGASAVRSADSTRTEGYLDALREISNHITKDINAYTDFVLAHLNLICVHDIYASNTNTSWKEKTRKLKAIINDPVIDSAVSDVTIRDILNLNRIPALFFKHGMYLPGGAVCWIKSKSNERKYR